MKRSYFVIAAFLGIILICVGNSRGPAAMGNGDRTGRLNAQRTCGAAGCHGAPSVIMTVTAEITDKASGDIVSDEYVPGTLYQVRLSCINRVNTNTRFGFQALFVGTGNVQAGQYSGLRSEYRLSSAGGVQLVEQGQTIQSSGTGYEVVFDWTAPAAGAGPVTLWAIFNGVNGNNNADAGDAVSSPFSLSLQERTTTSVAGHTELAIRIYPNPVRDYLDIRIGSGGTGRYEVSVYSLTGQRVYCDHIQTQDLLADMHISAADWQPGMYIVKISHGQSQWSVPFVRH